MIHYSNDLLFSIYYYEDDNKVRSHSYMHIQVSLIQRCPYLKERYFHVPNVEKVHSKYYKYNSEQASNNYF